MIDCAFKGHGQRATICEEQATSFFRTAKGTLWPLCRPCAERHKQLSLDLAKSGRLAIGSVAGAIFDLPLDDAEVLATWEAQDPQRIEAIIGQVDARHTELIEQFAYKANL